MIGPRVPGLLLIRFYAALYVLDATRDAFRPAPECFLQGSRTCCVLSGRQPTAFSRFGTLVH